MISFVLIEEFQRTIILGYGFKFLVEIASMSNCRCKCVVKFCNIYIIGFSCIHIINENFYISGVFGNLKNDYC